MQSTKKQTHEKLADSFFDLFYTGTFEIDPNIKMSQLSIDDAYEVQNLVTTRKVNKGENVIGYKVGCTSHAIQKQFGLNEPIYGKMFEPYIYDDGETIQIDNYVNCSIEPEIVLTIGTDLVGENLSDDELISAILEVRPGIELHNYKFWFSPTTSQELIASNGIWAGLVIGDTRIDPKILTFKEEVFHVFRNKEMVVKGRAAEIMSGLGPLESIRLLVRSLTKKGECLPAGSLVIPGSPVELIPIQGECELKITIDKVGSVKAHFNK